MYDSERIAKLYKSGMTIAEVADEIGCSTATVHKHLKQLSIETDTRGGSEPIQVNDQKVIDMYRSGDSVQKIADAHDVSRTPINRILDNNNVSRRSASEANEIRFSNMSQSERSKLTNPANRALRNKSDQWKTSVSRKQAISKQKTLNKIGKGEWETAAFFAKHDITPVMQKALGVYNLDVAVGSVGVEVHNAKGHPHTEYRSRIQSVLESGWHIFYIKIRFEPLQELALMKAMEFFNAARQDPQIPRQYRLIDGSGDFLAHGKLENGSLSVSVF
ncbi:transposase-like protein [Salinibacter ruber]|uniref:helix-turn-helix domain-containing protein n=1 Tax=Salinibacter ruber TaxID=146919 RepID=UPI00216A4C73|nr:helix-turn-helix domain-containing protein [Salinibacter ruber]MCS3667432.1 transposase-like protein [Salinibacter ruber]